MAKNKILDSIHETMAASNKAGVVDDMTNVSLYHNLAGEYTAGHQTAYDLISVLGGDCFVHSVLVLKGISWRTGR